MKMNHMGYVWTLLRKIFPQEVTLKIKGMKQFTNMEGAAFDVPEDISNHFEEVIKKDKYYNKSFTIERPTSLPDLSDGGKMGFVSNGGGNANSANNSSHGGGDRRGKIRKDIFLGNLPFQIDVEDIKEFLKSNNVDPELDIDVRIAQDRDTGKQKGFAFISAYDETKYSNILKLNGKKLNDRMIKITDANDKGKK